MRIIAGPCLHEKLDLSVEIATECKRVCDKWGIDYIFKASFDKANRSSLASERGDRFYGTMLDFAAMKTIIPDLKITTDFHTVAQIEDMHKHFNSSVDVIQIPSFLSRQTDLIVAAANTGKIVNIKKGQFMAPWDIHNVVKKAAGAKQVWITERGTSFGYDDLVVDFAGMEYLADHADFETFFDVTHSVQKIDGDMVHTLKDYPWQYAPGLLRAASALGIGNFFMEVHPEPTNSASDKYNMIRLDHFEHIVNDIVRFNYTHE